jgi:two-component system, cell cycle response regulator DivK
VDDSSDNRDMAAMLLETAGFDTITAGNGLEGVIVAHYTRPAVVIMDIAMPVLDGVHAARLLKASQVTQAINVIAYTAKMSLGDDAPLDQLFVDVLKKPASPETMIGLVQRFALPGEPEAA